MVVSAVTDGSKCSHCGFAVAVFKDDHFLPRGPDIAAAANANDDGALT